MTVDRSGVLWVSLPPAGVYRLRDGTWTRFTGTANFPAGPALTEFTDVLGRVWFGFTGTASPSSTASGFCNSRWVTAFQVGERHRSLRTWSKSLARGRTRTAA